MLEHYVWGGLSDDDDDDIGLGFEKPRFAGASAGASTPRVAPPHVLAELKRFG